jgi:hypothetical protein
MNTLWQAITWDVARAGGFTAYILLMLSVAIGLALTMHLQSPSFWPRILNNELHNFVTLLALIFTGIHVLAVTVDPFTRFGLNEVFVPLVSHYRPIWMALGIIALYLGLAIGLSTWLRPLIGYTWWRRLHVLTLVVFALVTIHGIATGSDTQTWWGFGIYAASIALVAGLLIRRLLVPATQRERRHPIFASLAGMATLATLVFMLAGPMRPGWNALAGGTSTVSAAAVTQSSGASPSQGSASGDPFASPFAASLQGMMTQNGPDSNGVETLHVNTTLSNGAQGVLAIVLQGTPEGSDDGGSRLSINSTSVMLGTQSATSLYQGQVTALRDREYGWRMVAVLAKSGSNGTQVQLQIALNIDSSGQVSGTIQGTPTQGQNTPSSPNSGSVPE